jgi:predicted porin
MIRFNTSLAAVAVLALSIPASASDWTFDWGGQANLTGYGIDEDEVAGNDLEDFGFAAEGKAWGRVRAVTESGIEYGLRGQLRFQSREHEFSNDLIGGAPDVVDEAWFYLQTAFGRLTLGLDDGAADSAGIFSPTVSDINRLDDPRAFALRNPLATGFAPYTPNGAHIRTDLSASGDAFKAIYYSPRLIGVQLSASYTPELSRGLNELFTRSDDVDRQGDIWEVGLNYQGALSAFDVGFYAGYVKGYNEAASSRTVGIVADALGPTGPTAFTSIAFTPDDLEEWGAGGQVSFEGLKLGGSFKVTNVAGGAGLADGGAVSVGCAVLAGCVLPGKNTTTWGAGTSYETGPWRFGVEYVNLEQELPDFLDGAVRRSLTQDAEAWSGAIGYEFDGNARIVAGYQQYAFEGPAGACVAGATPVCDTLDAGLGYIQTSISF